jgi:hypothetical protein
MFCYASLLVEGGYAEEINLSFLVVGHTHCNLDQNFSVLSKKIRDSAYIGSPVALHELYQHAHSELHQQPVLNIQLRYVYDWKSHFKDIMSKDIKYFQVPHRFRIIMHPLYKRSICQYMLFSNEDLVTEEWLPKSPPDSSSRAAQGIPQEFLSYSVQLYELAVVNGLPCLESYLGLNGHFSKVTAKARNDPDAGRRLSTYLETLPKLMDIEKESLAAQIAYFDSEADTGPDEQRGVTPSILYNAKKSKAEIQR